MEEFKMQSERQSIGATVLERPIKLVGNQTIGLQEIEEQAEAARECLREYDDNTRGTCIDERPRVGLLDGSKNVEARPSATGGPNIYALYLAELIGYFDGDEEGGDGEERLATVTDLINEFGIPSGGHGHCAANASFGVVIGNISMLRDEINAQVQLNMGDSYNMGAAEVIFDNATKTHQSGRYSNWSEDSLARVLGDEAGQAIEQLEDVPHLGKTFIRERVPGKTVDQTTLHEKTGEYSFVHTEDYAERIENAISSGPDAVRMTELSRHAREIVLAAIAMAVPNQELHGIILDSQQ